jgi:hypothetical protein
MSDTPLVVASVEERVPGLFGTQVLETYLAGTPTSRRGVVLLTGSPDAAPTSLHGWVLVLAEPFNLEKLLEAVAQAAARL